MYSITPTNDIRGALWWNWGPSISTNCADMLKWTIPSDAGIQAHLHTTVLLFSMNKNRAWLKSLDFYGGLLHQCLNILDNNDVSHSVISGVSHKGR